MANPMTATQLQRLLVGEKLTVVARKGWADHERDDETGKTFGPVHGVMIHHTAGLDVGNFLWSGSAKLPGPLCHGYIRKNGVIELMSAGRANHAGGGDPDALRAVITESYASKPPATKFHDGSAGAADGNDCFYGFECENKGDGKDPWPLAQYEAIVKASAAICRHYGWSEKSAIGHLEWSDWKVDPKGFSMVDFRADLKAALAMKPGAWKKGAVEPKLTVEQRLTRLEKHVGLA